MIMFQCKKNQEYILQHLHNCVHRYADQVVIGNDILVSGNNEMISAKVINISNYKAQGRYYAMVDF